MELESEFRSLIKVWITVLASLTYSYFISKILPKGFLRFILILPIIPIFIVLPLSLSSVHLLGTTGFFIAWLANFKLLLFSFGQGPLSSPSISFLHFIFIACLPIKIKENPPTQNKVKQNPSTQMTKSNENDPPLISKSTQSKSPKSTLIYFIKVLILVPLIWSYNYKHKLHPYLILVLYCVHIYISLEIILAVFAGLVQFLLGLELEPQFNQPLLSTSLQDFWGRRWNLMVTGILRPAVYVPIRYSSTRILGKKWGQLLGLLATFVVSGLMHELIFFYFGRVWPTGEVFSLFLLHGVCLAVEIEMKKYFKGRWRLPQYISGPLAVGFVVVTGFWLFFPQYLRSGADVRAIQEYAIFWEFIRNKFGGKMIGGSLSEH